MLGRKDDEIILSIITKSIIMHGDVNTIQNQAISVKMNVIGSLNNGRTAHFVLIEGCRDGEINLCCITQILHFSDSACFPAGMM